MPVILGPRSGVGWNALLGRLVGAVIALTDAL